jgi:hypothetical protein
VNIHFDKFENLHHWGSMSCSISWFALFTGVTFQGVWVVMEKYNSWSRDPRESWSQTLPDARQTLPALKVIYDYCSLVNEHDFAVGLYFMFVQMFLSWVSDGSCWNIYFSLSSREWLVSCWDWRFFFKQSDLFCQTISWVPSVYFLCTLPSMENCLYRPAGNSDNSIGAY